jgi:hypothetical protein
MEQKRVDFYSQSGDIFLFEFSSQVSLDKGGLSDASVSDENELEFWGILLRLHCINLYKFQRGILVCENTLGIIDKEKRTTGMKQVWRAFDFFLPMMALLRDFYVESVPERWPTARSPFASMNVSCENGRFMAPSFTSNSLILTIVNNLFSERWVQSEPILD